MKSATAPKLHSTLVAPGTIRMERLLPGPLERVWAYIVEGEKRAKWLAAGEFSELRVGGRICLQFNNTNLSDEKASPGGGRGEGAFEGVITRIEPMKLLAHTWDWSAKGGDAGNTEVTYELTPKGKQVLLTITHVRMPKDLIKPVMAGWDVHSGILEDVLEGRKPRGFWSNHSQLEKEYAEAR
jgi:uncharacterized protein YndB with AHSA1/START domain